MLNSQKTLLRKPKNGKLPLRQKKLLETRNGHHINYVSFILPKSNRHPLIEHNTPPIQAHNYALLYAMA